MEQRVITVFGGAGFLGRYVVQLLARSGYRLRIISRNPELDSELYTLGDVGQIKLLSGDITKPESYKQALTGCYCVINLVGVLFENSKQGFAAVHSLGAEKLAISAKSAGVSRFIHVSALGVNNERGSNYTRSKLIGERAVLSAFPEATILRPSVLFGAEDNFFNKFAKMAAISPAFPLIGGGKTMFQPVYVGDVARAIEICLLQPESKGQIYELAGSRTYSFKQILEYILTQTGKRRLLLSIPFPVAAVMAKFMEMLPNPVLTCDQVKSLKHNNILGQSPNGLALLGIKPTQLESVVPVYLSIYHKKAAA